MSDTPRTLQSRIIEMADNVTFGQQLGQDAGRVVLLNVFRLAGPDKAKVAEAWRADANYMKQQPGFISAQLHVGHAGSNVLFNYAVWENVASLRAAVQSPIFQEHVKAYPVTAHASPHVFRTLSIEGVCDGDVSSVEG